WASAAIAAKPRQPDLLNTLGAALYRAGRFEEGARRLEEAVALRGGEDSVADRLLLAMAYSQAGRSATARSWLAKAVPAGERPDRPGPPGPSGPVPLPWPLEIEHQVLGREAVALVLAPDL